MCLDAAHCSERGSSLNLKSVCSPLHYHSISILKKLRLKMKSLLVVLGVLGSLIALAVGKPAEDASTARLLLRSCDHNADNALNAAEFAGCLMQTSRQQRIAAQRMPVSRSELLQSFMDEADSNKDLRADEEELQKWSERWFLSGLFEGSASITLNFNELIGKVVVILQYISEENYTDAVAELYVLVSGSELSEGNKVSVNLAITAINEEKYGEAIGYIYSIIRDIAGGDDAGGIFIVSSSTVTNIASLLQAVIQSDTTNINIFLYRSMAGLIVDISFLSQESASAVAALIQAVVEDNTEEVYSSLKIIIKDIPGLSESAVTALTELLDVVISGQSSEIGVKIIAVFSAILEDESAAEIVEIFVSSIQAIADGNSVEAVRQLTLLYAKITGDSTTESSFSSTTVVTIATLMSAVEDEDSAAAITATRLLISSSRSEFSSSQLSSLELIIQAIEDEDYDEARRLIVAIATSGGSSESGSVVEVSVEVFTALSSVIIAVEESDDTDAAIAIIEEILSDSSMTISVEMREALQVLLIVLSEESSEEAVTEIAAIMTGSSQAFGRTVSTQVRTELDLIMSAIDNDDSNEAIAIIEALLNDENGGDSLSIVVKNEFKQIVKALKKDKKSKARAQLIIISSETRSSSLSVSATSSLFATINEVSSGSDSDAISELELLLEDDDLDSKYKDKIKGFVKNLKEKKKSKAMTGIVASLISSDAEISKSAAAILYASFRFAAAGESGDAIEEIEKFLEENSDSEFEFVLYYVIQLLKEENSQGALTIINTIIMEAFGDDCYCD
ncbi:Armadillo-type fold [Trinorchestia longiramus]|nr:Armadillo-type fold [Trinorchestia longiramus]